MTTHMNPPDETETYREADTTQLADALRQYGMHLLYWRVETVDPDDPNSDVDLSVIVSNEKAEYAATARLDADPTWTLLEGALESDAADNLANYLHGIRGLSNFVEAIDGAGWFEHPDEPPFTDAEVVRAAGNLAESAPTRTLLHSIANLMENLPPMSLLSDEIQVAQAATRLAWTMI